MKDIKLTEDCQSGDTPELSETTATAKKSLKQLSSEHLRQLRDKSGIAEDVIAERGYMSNLNNAALRELGFSPSQCRLGLVFPLYNTHGQIHGYQLRPNEPRLSKSKVGEKSKLLKYELPANRAPVLDIHPRWKEKIKDPNVRLFFTEGVKKADAATSRGLCTVSLQGVWGFRGRNEFGGITTLADLDDIALNSREVCVVFDSDVMVKPQVQQALERFAAVLKKRGADVEFIYLPYEEGDVQ